MLISEGSCDGSESPLCGSVSSVPLWFDRLLESISVNDPEVAMPWPRRLLADPVTVAVAALCH
jgi:hypothetical protein